MVLSWIAIFDFFKCEVSDACIPYQSAANIALPVLGTLEVDLNSEVESHVSDVLSNPRTLFMTFIHDLC